MYLAVVAVIETKIKTVFVFLSSRRILLISHPYLSTLIVFRPRPVLVAPSISVNSPSSVRTVFCRRKNDDSSVGSRKKKRCNVRDVCPTHAIPFRPSRGGPVGWGGRCSGFRTWVFYRVETKNNRRRRRRRSAAHIFPPTTDGRRDRRRNATTTITIIETGLLRVRGPAGAHHTRPSADAHAPRSRRVRPVRHRYDTLTRVGDVRPPPPSKYLFSFSRTHAPLYTVVRVRRSRRPKSVRPPVRGTRPSRCALDDRAGRGSPRPDGGDRLTRRFPSAEHRPDHRCVVVVVVVGVSRRPPSSAMAKKPKDTSAVNTFYVNNRSRKVGSAQNGRPGPGPFDGLPGGRRRMNGADPNLL